MTKKSTDDTDETEMASRYALAAIRMIDQSHAEAQRAKLLSVECASGMIAFSLTRKARKTQNTLVSLALTLITYI